MRTKFPLISVIVANFNRATYIDRCVRSLLSQNTSYRFEIIVVDDASEDASKSVLLHFEDQIRLIENKTNLGLPASVNKGIEASLGKYVIRVDSDDYVSEHFLQTLGLALEANISIDAASCDYVIFGEGDDGHWERIINVSESPIACGVMFRKDQLYEIGLYNPTFRLNEDKELMKRFEAKFRVTRIPIPLYRYRRHDKNMTNDKSLLAYYQALLSSDAGSVAE